MNQECYQNAAAILEQLKTEDGTDSNRLIRSYAELIEGKLAGKQGNLDQAIKTFSAVMDNKSYPEKIRDLGRLALAKAEIDREKSNPEQAEEETRSLPQEEEAPHTAGTAEERLLAFIGGKAESALLMDAFNILLEEDIFRTNPQALEKLNGWVKARDASASRQPCMPWESFFWKKMTCQAPSKWRKRGSPNIPRAFPFKFFL